MSITKEEYAILNKRLDKLENAIDRIDDIEGRPALYTLHKKMKAAVNKLLPKGKLAKDLPFIVCANKYRGTWQAAMNRERTACGPEYKIPNIHEINQILECEDTGLLYGYYSRAGKYWLATDNCSEYACAIHINADRDTKIITVKKDEEMSFFFIEYKK